MTKHNNLPKKYTKLSANVQLVLPMNVGIEIPADDSVRLLSNLLEEMDYTEILQASACGGRPLKYPNRILFKIWIYAMMENIRSTRDIAKACTRDIHFRWLLEGHPAPSHNTINRFRQRISDECIDRLFSQLVNILAERESFSYDHVFIDGTKIEAAANRYTFVWKKRVLKNQEKMQETMLKELPGLFEKYAQDIMNENEGDYTEQQLESLLECIGCEIREKKIKFVYGTGKRKNQLQRDYETVEAYLARLFKYRAQLEILGDRSSYSKTDKDASFMRMKDDHMRNGQLKPGYNAQIAVSSEYIVGAELYQARADQPTFIPFARKLEAILPKKFLKMVMDAGYESEEIYQFLRDHNYLSFIKPMNYEQKKKRTYKLKYGKVENMTYDEEQDSYTCKGGQKLEFVRSGKQKRASGYESEFHIYEAQDCSQCEFAQKCKTTDKNKKIRVSHKFLEMREESNRNIITDEGKLLRMNRSIQVEGAFGVLKQDYGFRRFFTRGLQATRTEFLLLCFAYNVNKLHAKIQKNKEDLHLHKLKAG